MHPILIGTSGWAYPSWRPDFYPAKLAATKLLSHYVTRLTGVEVNMTFRQRVQEKTLTNWLNTAPEHFRFCFKAHQWITHIRRLKDVEESVKGFAESLQPASEQGKLGAVLFQLAPTHKADGAVLREFLSVLPPNLPSAFEFRHKSWFTDEVFTALADRKVAVCLAESDDRETPEVHTGNFDYYRFRRTDYTPEQLTKIAQELTNRAQAGPVFAFFKHEETPEGALWAERVLQMTRRGLSAAG